MKPRNKYKQIHIALPEQVMTELRKECFALRISQQEFMRSILRDYFPRRKGMDVYLQTKESLTNFDDNGHG
jgi:hypothetical protein